MPIFSLEDRNVLFVHIPKTAGSSVTQLFREKGWEVTNEDRSSIYKPGGANFLRKISPQHLHAEVITQIYDLDKFDVVFSMIRHPFSRFKSEFAYRNSHLSTDEITPGLVENWAFEELAEFNKDRRWADNHFRPQVDFITPRSMLFRLEDGLQQLAKLEASLRKVGKQNPEYQIRTVPNSNLSGIKSQLVPISPKLRRQLLRIYKKDFMSLGYDPNHSQL